MLDPEFELLVSRLLAEPTPPAELPPAALRDLLRKGAILSLLEDGSPTAVHALHQAALVVEEQETVARIVWALGEIIRKQSLLAVQALFDLALRRGDAGAALLLLEKRLLESDPTRRAVLALFHEALDDYAHFDPHNHLLSNFALQTEDHPLQEILLRQASRAGLKHWTLLFQALFHHAPPEYQALVHSFGLFNASEKALCIKLLGEDARRGSLESQSAICELFIQHDFLPARELAIQSGYHPAQPLQAALFYFLSEQWEAYKKVDYDASLLISAYEISNPAIQSRLIGLGRSSGQLEWTQRLSSASRKLWLGDLNLVDWDTILTTLQAGQQWDELWRLAQYASPSRSAVILTILKKADWSPEKEEDRQGFAALCQAAATCLLAAIPVAPLKIWRSPSQEVTCLDYDPLSGVAAAGTSQTAIHFWKIGPELETLPPIFSPMARTQSLAIGPGGQYFTAAAGDNILRLYDLAGGRLIKSMPGHQGLVKALVFHPDGKSLLSASFDYTVLSWRIPQGSQLPLRLNLKGEVFGLAVSPDGNYLLAAGSGKVTQVYRLPEGQFIHYLTPQAETITALAVAPSRTLSASCARDQSVQIDNYASGRSIHSFQSLIACTFSCFDQDGQYLALGGLDGRICFQEISNGQGKFLPTVHHAVITGLKRVQNGEGLLSASQDGQICWWDLRLWRAIQTPLEDLASISTLLKSFGAKSELSPAETIWFTFARNLLDWRRRFDIQIADEKPILHVGDFDIEL